MPYYRRIGDGAWVRCRARTLTGARWEAFVHYGNERRYGNWQIAVAEGDVKRTVAMREKRCPKWFYL